MAEQTHHEVEASPLADDYEGQERAKETRRAILSEAAKLFSSSGFDGCSTRDIAKAAGVSYANIRYHFGDKETLWKMVISFLQREAYQGRDLLSQLDISESPKTIFREHTRNVVNYLAIQPELARIFLFERMNGSDRLADIETIIRDISDDRIGHIESMQAAGTIRADLNPALLNELISGGIFDKFVVRPITNDRERERAIDAFTDMIVDLVEQR